jgi:UDP-2,3-diacylglucosamine pyrophosphatase LpxH
MRLFADDKFMEGYDAVILGHSHAETLSQQELNGRMRTFATLGDWMTFYTYLAYEDGRFFLNNFDKMKT